MAILLTTDLTNAYEFLYDTCIINEDKYNEIDSYINTMVAHQATYELVGSPLSIPWYFIAIIHCLECDLNFNEHLHNGDPLTHRTVHVPAGRPVADPAAGVGQPYSWQESAVDALAYDGFTAWTNWTIPGMLFSFEKYNGFGYRGRGINSPYLWSFSNQYTEGKFTNDGIYDADAVSDQCGAAVLLRRMYEKQLVNGSSTDRITMIKTLGATVQYNPDVYSDDAKQLQTFINAAGIALRNDGYAGSKTSAAYFQITGVYLNGDPRI
jgi:lysozyme family protein